MRRHIVQLGLLTAFVAVCAPGCRNTSEHAYPDDPLFMNKKPIEAKVDTARPTVPTHAQPTMPPIPVMVLAASRLEPFSGTALAGPTQKQAEPLPADEPERRVLGDGHPGHTTDISPNTHTHH